MTTTDQKTTVSKAPSHIAYHIYKDKSGKKHWTRIGAIWPHADGKGSNLQLDPITIRINSEKPE